MLQLLRRHWLATHIVMRGDICMYQGDELGLPHANAVDRRRTRQNISFPDSSPVWLADANGTIYSGFSTYRVTNHEAAPCPACPESPLRSPCQP